MAYVPKDAEWFLAELVEEIRVAGSKRNVVQINYVIIHAASPEAAFARAKALGRRNSISYENEMGKKVTIRFRGLRNLDVIYDPLEDGCEIMFEEKLALARRASGNWCGRKVSWRFSGLSGDVVADPTTLPKKLWTK